MVSLEVMERLQRRIDELSRRMRIDSNDLEYETHLRRKRELQQVLDCMKREAHPEWKENGFHEC